jgi:3-methyladenine DNA glycosylase/8-oxoguanine DNA glycosylase
VTGVATDYGDGMTDHDGAGAPSSGLTSAAPEERSDEEAKRGRKATASRAPAPARAKRAPETLRLALPDGYDFGGTIGALPMGRHDPSLRIAQGAFWWAARTPDGLGTLSLLRDGRDLVATGYGPGAQWVLAQADGVAGLRDDLTGFAEVAARHPVVAELARRHHGLRLPSTGRVFQRLVRAIFEQKVTGKEAYRAYSATIRHFYRESGREPAPGPLPGLLPPPDPRAVAATPYWVFHPFGVEQRRAETLLRAAVAAAGLESSADSAEATRRLTSIQGIGAWTAAEVVREVYGDPDAVSVGDYHIPHIVSWALAGRARAGSRDAGPDAGPGALSPADVRMLELLEPFRGHRGRVCWLLEHTGHSAPRFGPRMPVRSIAAY